MGDWGRRGGGVKNFRKVSAGRGSEIFILVEEGVILFGGGGEAGGLLKRYAPFLYLNHSFILSLNVKVCIGFIAFLQISLCFLFVKSYVG